MDSIDGIMMLLLYRWLILAERGRLKLNLYVTASGVILA